MSAIPAQSGGHDPLTDPIPATLEPAVIHDRLYAEHGADLVAATLAAVEAEAHTLEHIGGAV